MSSRWDSLKPGISSSKHGEALNSEANRGSIATTTNGARAKKQQHPRNVTTRGSGKWQPEKTQNDATNSSRHGWGSTVEKRSGRESSWRKSASSNVKIGGANNNLSGNQESIPPPRVSAASTRWEKLVQDLSNMGNAGNIEGSGNSTNNVGKLTPILQELSNLLQQSNDRSISGSQRGSALAAVFHLLPTFPGDCNLIATSLDWSCQLFNFSSISYRSNWHGELQMTRLQAQQSVTGLVSLRSYTESADIDRQTRYRQCCANLLLNFAPQLPAEETANQMVGGVLLPDLELLLSATSLSEQGVVHSSDGEEADEANALLRQEIQALHSLIMQKNHASALLAPLVNDVRSDGQELYLVNPLRRRIFQVLQTGLGQSCKWPTPVTQQIHMCLTLALQMVNTVDRSSSLPSITKLKNATNKQQPELDSHTMEKFFKHALCVDQTGGSEANIRLCRVLVLEMLQAYLISQPVASLSLGTVLLLRDNPNRPATDVEDAPVCPICNVHTAIASTPFPPFLALLHKSTNQDENNLAAASLAILVSNIPWKLWLGRKSPQNNRFRNPAVSNFSMRVLDAIRNVVLVAKCLLLSRWKSNNSSECLASLVKAILLDIPFESLDSASSRCLGVEQATCDLVETLACNLLQAKSRKSVLVDTMTEVLEESMGGRTTPQGSRTVMVAPVRSWLSSSSSQRFRRGLFDGIRDAARTPTPMNITTFKFAVKMLRSMLGTRPQTVLNTEANWKEFQDIILLLWDTENTTLQQGGLQLLESLLKGRRYVSQQQINGEPSRVVHLAFSVLPQMVASASGPCRVLSFQSYGSLLGSDWLKQLDEKRDNSMKCHLDLILNHCGGSEQAASARSAACKAIGDICSSCFLEEKELDSPSLLNANEELQQAEHLRRVGNEVCQGMLHAMDDSNATVRSMAIFAIGNLAQVVGAGNISNISNIFNPHILKKACLAVHRCLVDKNDKVVSNAIRSIGHMVVVVLSENYRNSLSDIAWDLDGFCLDVVLALLAKVDSITTVLSCNNHGGTTGLSWKQRSSIKKHGRVACNSLALMMRHSQFVEMSTTCNDGVAPCQLALCSLFKVIDCLGTMLDEKVIIAAMLAFRALPSASLARVSGKSGHVGKTLVACVAFLAKEQWSTTGVCVPSGNNFLLQVDLLCEHLVDSATISDATILISCSKITATDLWVEQLYEWMVLKNCSARSFGAFAIALQTPTVLLVRLPVLVEQKFANRATNLLRNEDLVQDGCEDDDDDDDEL